MWLYIGGVTSSAVVVRKENGEIQGKLIGRVPQEHQRDVCHQARYSAQCLEEAEFAVAEAEKRAVTSQVQLIVLLFPLGPNLVAVMIGPWQK